MSAKKQYLVSVIIPIYNGEKYLKDCLNSVLGQSYDNLEVLLINDGSTDASGALCHQYAEQDLRIRVYDKENGGVSTARNLGIEKAQGEYLLFVDGDDMLHRDYVGVCMDLLKEKSIDYFTFPILRVKSEEMEKKYSELQKDTKEQQFIVRDKRDSYLAMATLRNYWDFSAIGGKIIARKAIGDLRFQEKMHYGEDTLFLQQLMNQGVVSARGRDKWYLYRMHEENAIKSKYRDSQPEYLLSHLEVAEEEYRQGRKESAYYWQLMIYEQAQNGYEAARRQHDRRLIQNLKRDMKKVSKSPSVKVNGLEKRMEIKLFAISPFLSHTLCKPLNLARKGCRRLKRKQRRAGILTFHCADNYGAMLQAYGLKKALQDRGIPVDIIAYQPPYMTGRHWLIPYLPNESIKRMLSAAYRGLRRNGKYWRQFHERRRNMKRFRREYLKPQGLPKLFAWQLKYARYSTYVLGSDQIWNPDLTFRLRKPYFGNIHKHGDYAIAYAASFGMERLKPEYDAEFTELLRGLQAVSMREKSAIPYVQEHFDKEVLSVCDPVFLPDRESWKEIMVVPEKTGYVLIYATENITALYSYAKKLAQDKGLELVELTTEVRKEGVHCVTTAGPGEFLGYIYHADYVVSNSFHGLAFCTIFHKRFVAYLHSSRGARIVDMLKALGLENRINSDDASFAFPIDSEIDWRDCDRQQENLASVGKAFLGKYVRIST